MYQKTILPNGLHLLTADMPHTRSVSLNFFVRTGSRYEIEEQAGISHFIEHLYFKGTPRRPTAMDICTAIEGVGGLFNGGTDKELTIYWCKVARPHLELALDVLVDMVLNSKFDPAEIEKERQVIIEEINMSRDNPSQLVQMLIDGLLWEGHPLGRDVAGTRASVVGISRDTMLAYRSLHYQPANTTVVIAGGVQHEEVLGMVTDALGGWTGSGLLPSFAPFDGWQSRRVLIEKRDIEQVQLCLAMPGLSHLHPKRFILDLLNVILGEGMSSRLFTIIREKLGLAYSINSYADHLIDTGSITISAGVEPKNLRLAVRSILEELGKLRGPLPDTELTKAKELTKGRLLLRMEDSRNVAGWLGGQEVLTGRILSPDDIVDIVDGITGQEIQDMAGELLRGENFSLAVVGPVPPDEPLEELLHL